MTNTKEIEEVELYEGQVTDSRFNRFNQEVIDLYFNEQGKKDIDDYVASKVIEEHYRIKWQPDEAKFIEAQADRIATLKGAK